MSFVKWTSIENSYRDKHINYFLGIFPELADEEYLVTEKIHGSNFQWFLQPYENLMCGSRNKYLDVNGSFQGASIPALVDKHRNLLLGFQHYCDETGNSVRLFGELFGDGIQKGVDYGPEKRLLYFGLMINDKLRPPFDLLRYIPENHIAPIVGVVQGLDEALSINSEFDSWLSSAEDNICEGIVIVPYRRVYQTDNGETFILKKKNDAFIEKKAAPKTVVVDTEVQRLNSEFLLYINDNRLQSVFSKEGEIESPKEIGKYIRLILEDAKDDFLKDNDIAELDGGQIKQVFNVGGVIANMLKGYL